MKKFILALIVLAIAATVSAEIIDNTDAGFSADSTKWSISSSSPGFYGTNYVFATSASIDSQASWITEIQAGKYRIYARWTDKETHTISATYKIAAGTVTASKSVDQRTGGGAFVEIFTGDLPSGTLTITVTNAGSGSIIADAVKVERITGSVKKNIGFNYPREWFDKIGGFKIFIGASPDAIDTLVVDVKKSAVTIASEAGGIVDARFPADIYFPAPKVYFAMTAYYTDDAGSLLESDISESSEYILTSNPASTALPAKPANIKIYD